MKKEVIAIFYTVMLKKPNGKRFTSNFQTFNKEEAEYMRDEAKKFGYDAKIREEKCYS